MLRGVFCAMKRIWSFILTAMLACVSEIGPSHSLVPSPKEVKERINLMHIPSGWSPDGGTLKVLEKVFYLENTSPPACKMLSTIS